MNQPLLLSLQITLLGMGLVFGALILVWGVMAVLVRFTSQTETRMDEETELDLKRRAASAAVAAALAEQSAKTRNEFPLPSTALVSPWQAVMRTNMLNKRGQVR
jgi:Na+-transporting methylmalonyl-CoA/oxaloacetate decarboxylase gamma subunit